MFQLKYFILNATMFGPVFAAKKPESVDLLYWFFERERAEQCHSKWKWGSEIALGDEQEYN
jgi:hypothetical protein